MLNSQPYLPAQLLARELRGHEHWDSQAQIWVLTVGGHELRAAAHLTVVLLDGAPYELPSVPVIDSQGRLLLPERLWTDRLARWSAPQRLPSPEAPRHIRTIVLDAGHGGHDPGAIGPSGLREKALTLEVVQHLRDLLTRDGFRVVLTRRDDRFIPLQDRSAVANREEAHLFVSIHANSSRRRSASGFEVYTLSEATDDHARALETVENTDLPDGLNDTQGSIPESTQAIVWDLLYTEHRAESTELGHDICRALSQAGVPWKNRGVKSARFVVLKKTRMPAVLVEVGFISHPQEEAKLRKGETHRRLAQGIRDGILRYQDRIEREYAYAQ